MRSVVRRENHCIIVQDKIPASLQPFLPMQYTALAQPVQYFLLMTIAWVIMRIVLVSKCPY